MDTTQNWIKDRVFENNDFVVLVSKLPLRRPRFSINIGMRRGENLQKFMPIQSTGHGLGKVAVKPFASPLYQMLIEVQDYIQSELQRVEDEELEFKLQKETRQMNKDKPKQTAGLSGGFGSGKTARRREAKRKAAQSA